eukprot:6427154-Pyramimonas_sp.AAC.1
MAHLSERSDRLIGAEGHLQQSRGEAKAVPDVVGGFCFARPQRNDVQKLPAARARRDDLRLHPSVEEGLLDHL